MNQVASDRGIIYISNLPHGFYEYSLRRFFSQFGRITNIKVKRSDKNAKPMGYAYIEFEYLKVAKIVVKTMDNYLMFNKLVKCRLVEGGDSMKIFRKRYLKAKFCNGTKRKMRNQYKLENVSEEKINKKLEKAKKKLGKVLGKKVDLNPSTQNSSEVKKSEEKDNVSNKDSVSPKIKNTPKSCQGQFKNERVPKKNKTTKIGIRKKGNNKPLKVKLNKINSKLQTPPKQIGIKISKSVKETPLIMKINSDIDDDEIKLKTPPNVIKQYKKKVLNTRENSLTKQGQSLGKDELPHSDIKKLKRRRRRTNKSKKEETLNEKKETLTKNKQTRAVNHSNNLNFDKKKKKLAKNKQTREVNHSNNSNLDKKKKTLTKNKPTREVNNSNIPQLSSLITGKAANKRTSKNIAEHSSKSKKLKVSEGPEFTKDKITDGSETKIKTKQTRTISMKEKIVKSKRASHVRKPKSKSASKNVQPNK